MHKFVFRRRLGGRLQHDAGKRANAPDASAEKSKAHCKALSRRHPGRSPSRKSPLYRRSLHRRQRPPPPPPPPPPPSSASTAAGRDAAACRSAGSRAGHPGSAGDETSCGERGAANKTDEENVAQRGARGRPRTIEEVRRRMKGSEGRRQAGEGNEVAEVLERV